MPSFPKCLKGSNDGSLFIKQIVMEVDQKMTIKVNFDEKHVQRPSQSQENQGNQVKKNENRPVHMIEL